MKAHTFIKHGVIYLFAFTQINSFASNFSIKTLSPELQSKLKAYHLWQTNCPVKIDDLRIISVDYYNVDGSGKNHGQLILHKLAAKSALNVFKNLYSKKFPLTTLSTLVEYQGDVAKAEAKNTSYGFVCKTENAIFSPESYGTTLSINPIINPEISFLPDRSIKVLPAAGIFAVNRSLHLQGMTEGFESILAKNGFSRRQFSKDKISWKQFIFHQKINSSPSKSSFLQKTQSNSLTTFSYAKLSDDNKAMLKRSHYWHEKCPVDLDRLNILNLSYYDFEGKTHVGQLIVLDTIAPFMVHAFQEFYQKKFPIESLPSNYNVSDEGGTSSFNCRPITGKNGYSLHSFGLAIDINISRNPYIGSYTNNQNTESLGTLIPSTAFSFEHVNRTIKQPGMNEAIVNIMKRNGLLEWGGNWEDRIDFMHFQVPTAVVYNLAQMDKLTGIEIIKLIIKDPASAEKMSADSRWIYLYEMNPKAFIKGLKKYFPLLKNEKENKVMNLIYESIAMS